MLSIEKVEMDIDSVYIKASPKLVSVGGVNEVNLDIEILKEESGSLVKIPKALFSSTYQFHRCHVPSYCLPP